MSTRINTGLCLSGLLMVLLISCSRDEQEAGYQPGVELSILMADLKSQEYLDMVETMSFPDLRQEWKRVATPDNYVSFTEKHGGLEKVNTDPQLKNAYDLRKQTADGFIALMDKAFTAKGREPSFTREEAEAFIVTSSKLYSAAENLEKASINYVMPARGAKKQWPGFRGPTAQGIARKNKIPLSWSETDNIRWKAELYGRGNSSPIVWDKKLFITTASEDGKVRELLCFNRTDGELRWKKAAPEPKNIEKLIWKNSYASTTPITDGERVIAFFGNSGFVCYDMDGDLLWTQSAGEFITTHGPGTNLAMYRDKVILIQDQNRGESVFVALDKNTGEILWNRQREKNLCWASPVIVRINGRVEMIYNGSHRVVSYDPDTGEEIWSVNGPSREAIPMIVTGGGLIYSQSGRNGPILAIRPGGIGDVTETHIFWQNLTGGPHVPSPVYYQERLYIIDDTGTLTCINALTGQVIWKERLKGRFTSSPVLSGNKIIITNEKGLTSIFKAGDSFELLAENDLMEETLASPAVLGGQIFIRTANHLYCIDKD